MSDNEVLYIRSSLQSLNKSDEGDSSNNEDIWDDTILIEAYDKAVQLAQQNFLKKKQLNDNSMKFKKKENENLKWKVGDKCKCKYSEDLNFYEADIIDIKNSICTVKYIGYENEEEVPLKALKPSDGDSARLRQIQQATADNDNLNNMEIDSDSRTNSEKKSQSFKKKSFNKKKGHSKDKNGFCENSLPFSSFNLPFPPVGNSMIPPPPPPHMFNTISEDENETEAMSAMLISWYMSGYHTGYYQGLKMAKKK